MYTVASAPAVIETVFMRRLRLFLGQSRTDVVVVVGGDLYMSVPDEGHPHVRVGLEAKGEDGDADEEHRYHTNHLQKYSN